MLFHYVFNSFINMNLSDASCMNRASVFEWHKRCKEGRESVRDDKRWKRNKEVDWPKGLG